MIERTRITMVGIIVAIIATACTPSADASREAVDVRLSQPVILAGSTSTIYLKIGLQVDGEGEYRAPVNLAIVIDRSGSMQGEKLMRAKEAAKAAVNRLHPDDIVSVVAYDDTVRVLLPATKVADRTAVLGAIDALEIGGNTALFAGVSVGAAELRKFFDRERVNRVVLLSDGLANVGPASPAELGALGASLKKEGISVSTIGLGLGYNEDLMVRLAGHSDGNHAFVEHPRDLARIFDLEFGDAVSVTAQDVLVQIECAEGTRPVRVLGREAEITGRSVTVTVNQLYDAREQYILLELEAPAGSSGQARRLANVHWSYLRMGTTTTKVKGWKSADATYTTDMKKVQAEEDSNVMVAVVEQIATEQNRLALDLRDQGRIDEAQALLLKNTVYARDNAARYQSETLADVAVENETDAQQIIKQEEWTTQRKSMTERYLSRSRQKKQ
jgi:Ca-activated chloride channel family protein